MSATQQTRICPDEALAEVAQVIAADDAEGLRQVDLLLRDYDLDARLHFLRGSLLAALKRYPEAILAIGRAVAIAPDFALARFQLGLLQLSSGDASSAVATWSPLHNLSSEEPLRLFAQGLEYLAQDRFADTVSALTEGISRNGENPALNADMQLVIRDALQAMDNAGPLDQPISETHLLLRRYSDKGTMH
jgi:tetratricopeptide (TPR) repeat protein